MKAARWWIVLVAGGAIWLAGCTGVPTSTPVPSPTSDVRAASAARWATLFRDDASRLRQKYPDRPVAAKRATILLPMDDLTAFSGLQTEGCCYLNETLAGYRVELRDPTVGKSTSRVDGATLTGQPGRNAFDDRWATLTKRAPDCAGPGPCDVGLGFEWVVPELQVSGRSAFASVGANGKGEAIWAIFWYDPDGDASYELRVFELTARHLMDPGDVPASDAGKLMAAQRMAELASQLVAMPT